MKIECIKEKIFEAVTKADRFTGKNATLPALSGILLEAKDQELIVRGTNLDLGIEITIPVKVISPGKVLLPGNTFSQFLTHLRGEKNITLELKKDTLVFSSQLEDVKFKTLPLEDFPLIPKQQPNNLIEIEAQSLSSGLKSAFFAASPSSMKPELSSVYVYGENDTLVFVGTDSFRLAEKKVRIKDSFDGSFLVPFKNVSELTRILDGIKGKVELGISKNQISIQTEAIYLVSRTVEGSYPDYRQIIPKEPKTEIVCLKDDFENVCKATGTFTDRFHQISFDVSPQKNHFTISSRNQDTGELTEKIDATLSGESVAINFNHKYISDVFQALPGDSLSISLNGAGKPAVIRGVGDGNFLYVVMPMNR
ncbi:MAG: DNA polymerase III subunit beta [Minisyncoccia bacterium]